LIIARHMRLPVDVGQIIDAGRWSGYQKWIVCLTALTIVFDGIDNQLLGVSIPTLMREWGVPRTAFAPVVSLGYAGMMLGGAVAGLAGDRWGRRSAVASMVVLRRADAGDVAAHDTAALGWFASSPAWVRQDVERGGARCRVRPVRQRPIAVTVTIVCVPLGATSPAWSASASCRRRLAHAFVLAGDPAAAAAVLGSSLPESPRFLARRPQRWPELVRTLGRMGRNVHRHQPIRERADVRARVPVAPSSPRVPRRHDPLPRPFLSAGRVSRIQLADIAAHGAVSIRDRHRHYRVQFAASPARSPAGGQSPLGIAAGDARHDRRRSPARCGSARRR
jgi:AAHS family 4-hydroxybenzoate transporter-like MFS transporter